MSAGKGSGRNVMDGVRREARSAILVVAALSFGIGLLAFVPSIYSLQVYDRVMTSRNLVTLGMISGIVLVLFVASALIDHFRSQVLVQLGLRIDRMLAAPTFNTTLDASVRARGPQHVQALRDVDTLRETLSGNLVPTLLDAPWTPVFLVVCYLFHPLIGHVALGGAVILFVIALLNDRLTKAPLVQAQLISIQALDRLSASLRNSEAIRGLGMGPAVMRHWSTLHERSLAHAVSAGERGGSLVAGSKFLRQAVQTAVMGVGAYLVVRQEVSGGVLFASSLMMGRALAPVESLVGQWKGLVSARLAWARLSRLHSEASSEPERMALPEPIGHVSVENLTLVAPGTRNAVVKGVSFQLRPGEVVAVVGATGSGKSSLARALVGAWGPAQGCVRIDGNDLRHYPVDQIGRHIGYLPQDVELLAGTVRENIARFRDDASDDAVHQAALVAHAHGMIQRFPEGYATPVGEDGVGLSGGQRQRVGLARALFGNPAIVVLDEPNANLDGEGDKALSDAIVALRRSNRTVVVVTHKQNLLAVADRVIVMQDGMVRTIGTPEEILNLGRAMNERQPAVPAARAA
jgi:PrtD family type I secretion system ABC transporter